MSSSLSTATPAAAQLLSTTPASLLGGNSSGHQRNSNAPAAASAAAAAAAAASTNAGAAQFREIHKNTWLKRLSADGKRFTVGPKKSECSWVVFCVHDDTEALLEGYAEPRQAAAHMPEWVVSLRDTLHISHALIPNSHEFEFVVTLSNEVLRFHAVSWEIMQEWVETLRSKLREMKILSPRENLYTKLPEVRAPLLPTRDPTSPLPAPPPVPAAIVPGVERVAHQSNAESSRPAAATAAASADQPASALALMTNNSSSALNTMPASTATATPHPTAMSNTLTQHLLNMLSDPISTYSEQINEATPPASVADDTETPHSTADVDFDVDVNGDDLNLSDDEFLSPLLRKACLLSGDNGVRLDVAAQRASADQILNLEHMLQCERLIPRPQTSRSMSAGAADKSKRPRPTPSTTSQSNQATASVPSEPQDNITIIQVSNSSTSKAAELPPKLPPKSSITADIFRFPEIQAKAKTKPQQQLKLQPNRPTEYKSNVQIIPSNSNSSTIQVLGQAMAIASNPYTVPVKTNAASQQQQPSSISAISLLPASTNTTMVHVLGDEPPTTTVAVYGTCYPSLTPTLATPASSSSGHSSAAAPSTPKLSKKIILSANSSGVTNISVNHEESAGDAIISGNVHYEKVFLSSSIPISSNNGSIATLEPQSPSPRSQLETTQPQLPPLVNGSPALPRRRIASPPTANSSSSRSVHRPQLTRGLTELVISSRPSRRDFHYLKLLNTPLKAKAMPSAAHKTPSATNNNIVESSSGSASCSQAATPVHRSNAAAVESSEQRRRSSSTSDAQAPLQRQANSQRGANNNEFVASARRPTTTATVATTTTAVAAAASPNKRMTLREQQVMQLRREIMHPGGVRLNLRRKDCVGSIAWVDAFGGIWIAGWKQKEHPVLYNALHIGDQLLTIAGVSISSAAEANKIIRNTNTLFVEVLLRRMPFGRAYAIRRDREGQCLGLIRDGNTSTIVDIVPNSLAARHGLPPKAQSCDGSSLTFWILTEINGRPLNLFFKELEIRDRLNSVGRDISILVQPSDLITKLKKQLKSLRGYKDYLVQ